MVCASRRSNAFARVPAASVPARSPCAYPLANASRSSSARRIWCDTSTPATVSDSSDVSMAWGAVPVRSASRTGMGARRPACQSYGCASSSTRLALDDIRFARRRARDDQAFPLELARNGDDFLLGLLYLAQAEGTHQFH